MSVLRRRRDERAAYIRVANSLTFAGQLYSGGTVRFDNAVDLQFPPMSLPGQGSTTSSAAHSLVVTGKWEDD